MLAHGLCYLRDMDKETTPVERCLWIPDCAFDNLFIGKDMWWLDTENHEAFCDCLEDSDATFVWQAAREKWRYLVEQFDSFQTAEARFLRS